MDDGAGITQVGMLRSQGWVWNLRGGQGYICKLGTVDIKEIGRAMRLHLE